MEGVEELYPEGVQKPFFHLTFNGILQENHDFWRIHKQDEAYGGTRYMLGQDNRQLRMNSIDALETWGKPILEPGSFYDRLSKAGDIFSDDLFADVYSKVGAPSIPPSRLIKVLLLQAYCNVSDREAEERAHYDLRWKKVLHLPLDETGFDYSTLSRFRARLLLSGKGRAVFKEVLKKAEEKGFLKPSESVQIMDSTHVFGAGAVEDTYTLIKKSIAKLLSALGTAKKDLVCLFSEPLRLDYSKKGKPKINWEDAKAREDLLNDLVHDAQIVLEAAGKLDLTSRQRELYELLVRVSGQDVERGEDGRWRLKQGVAKDRIISTTDPEMRHGRKSRARVINGYKAHIAMDAESELVVGVEATPANVHDGEAAPDVLSSEPEELKPKKIIGDVAYGTAKLRQECKEENIEVMAPVPGPDLGPFGKQNFEIDLDAQTCICPGGQQGRPVKNKRGEPRAFTFSPTQCGACLFKEQCIKSRRGYRVISLNPREKELQKARAEENTPEFKAYYNATRPKVERKLAEAAKHSLRDNRYIGRLKTRLHVLLVFTAVNLKRLARLEFEAALPLTEPA